MRGFYSRTKLLLTVGCSTLADAPRAFQSLILGPGPNGNAVIFASQTRAIQTLKQIALRSMRCNDTVRSTPGRIFLKRQVFTKVSILLIRINVYSVS